MEQTRRKDGREARFQDFVSFIDFESSVINDSVYSRCIAPEKKPLHVNTSVVKDVNVGVELVNAWYVIMFMTWRNVRRS